MRSNDLVPLLSGSNSKGVSIRQGVVQYWNPDTAENTVLVEGSLFTNLPILNTSEASLLTAGNTVSILVQNNSYAIFGRMVIPGTPEAVSSIQAITNRIQAASDITGGSRNSTTFGDLTGTDVGPSVSIRIGTSGRALVFWSAEIGQTPVLMSDLNPHVAVQVSGASTVAPSVDNALNFEFYHGAAADFQAWWQAGTFHLYTGLNVGMTTFTLKYAHQTVSPSTTVNFQAREIAVFAL